MGRKKATKKEGVLKKELKTKKVAKRAKSKPRKVVAKGVVLNNFKTDPSPHVLDLRKIVAEKKKEDASLEARSEKMSFFKFRRKNKKEEAKKITKKKEEKVSKSINTEKRLNFSFKKKVSGALNFVKSRLGNTKLFFKNIFSFSLLISLLKFPFLRLKQTRDNFRKVFSRININFVNQKKALSLGLIAFVLILPLQAFSYYGNLKRAEDRIMEGANDAYSNLLESGDKIANSDFFLAAKDFEEAAGAFVNAQREVNKINFFISTVAKTIPQGKKIEAGDALFFAGEKLSLVGKNLLESLATFTKNDDDRLTPKIKILRDKLSSMIPEVSLAADRLSTVDSKAIPEDKRELFVELQSKLPHLVSNFKKLISISDLMIKFLGDESSKRYLFVFQNTGELRPAGGFLGSLALVDFDSGRISNIEVPKGGPYDFQGSLKENIAAPYPMRLLNSRWELQDANWFADFPLSAKKIKWFYEKSGGPTIDGVVAINSDLVVDLLEVLGPISLPYYDKVITSDNFIEEVQKAVEIEYDRKKNNPKKIIGDLTPILLDKIFNSSPKDFGRILSIFAKGLTEKNILLHSVFPEIEHEISSLAWGGDVKEVDERTDYLMVVHSNIGGGKTDQIMRENVKLETTIGEDGYIKNKLTIKREHPGEKHQLFTGTRNVDYLRIYVPKGSILVSADGFEAPDDHLFEKIGEDYKIDLDLKRYEQTVYVDPANGTAIGEEFGKTVFANWVQTDPGETALVTFEYILPFKFDFYNEDSGWRESLSNLFSGNKEKFFYQILVQKQPGSKINFSNQIDYPVNLKAEWYYGENMNFKMTSVEAVNYLNTDKFYLLGFTKR